MKKEIFDLTIEEFTRLLLDYEKKYQLEVTYNDKTKKVFEGTLMKLLEFAEYNMELQNMLMAECFDYDITLDKLDIYNYLEFKTSYFNPEKVKIILEEMNFFYCMIYLEDIDKQAHEEYISKGKEIPMIECRLPDEKRYLLPNYELMREHVFPGRDFIYTCTISLLKEKCKNINSSDLKLPEKLNTNRAKKYIYKALCNGIIERYNDGLKKKGITKAQLAYFLECIYCKGEDGKDNGLNFPEADLEKLFNESRIGKARGQLVNNKNNSGKPKGSEIIDKIFDDKLKL